MKLATTIRGCQTIMDGADIVRSLRADLIEARRERDEATTWADQATKRMEELRDDLTAARAALAEATRSSEHFAYLNDELKKQLAAKQKECVELEGVANRLREGVSRMTQKHRETLDAWAKDFDGRLTAEQQARAEEVKLSAALVSACRARLPEGQRMKLDDELFAIDKHRAARAGAGGGRWGSGGETMKRLFKRLGLWLARQFKNQPPETDEQIIERNTW